MTADATPRKCRQCGEPTSAYSDSMPSEYILCCVCFEYVKHFVGAPAKRRGRQAPDFDLDHLPEAPK